MTNKGKKSWREYFWYVLLFVNPFLTYKIIVSAMGSVNRFDESGVFQYQDGFVLIATLTLILCLIVPILLKDSESDFKIGAIVLTAAIPAALTALCWYRLIQIS